jgi:hypothetical protein
MPRYQTEIPDARILMPSYAEIDKLIEPMVFENLGSLK